MQHARVFCGPGCLRTNAGAGVFLFVIRGRPLIHELSSAETVIQYMLTGGVESEGGSLNHSVLYSPKFNLFLKQKTALILAIPDIVKIFSWKCIYGTWRMTLVLIWPSGRVLLFCAKHPLLYEIFCMIQVKTGQIPTAEPGWECLHAAVWRSAFALQISSWTNAVKAV